MNKIKQNIKILFSSIFILLVIFLIIKSQFSEPLKLKKVTINNIKVSKNYESIVDSLKVTENIKYFSNNNNYSNNSLPILYYHCVSNDIFGTDELFVSPDNFENQMEYLSKNNYTVITFNEIKHINNIKKPIIITFDDGYENNYTEAYPILKKYNFKATIFLTYNSVGKKNYLKKDQIKKMLSLVNFQGHTNSHPDLRKLSIKELKSELIESKLNISSLSGDEVNIFAYPTGYYNDKILKMTKENYDYAVTNQGGLYYLNSDDKYLIKRVYIQRGLDINGFANKILLGTF